MLSRGQKFNFLIAKDRGHRDRARTSANERDRARTSAGSSIRDPRLSAMYSFNVHSFRSSDKFRGQGGLGKNYS